MEEFYKLLDKHIEGLNHKFQVKFSVKQSLYDDIILVLRDGWGDSQLKFWVNKNFKLIKIGDQNVVYGIKSNHPIVTYENLYIKIKECHERVGHHGRDKTWIEVKDQYAWVPFDSVKLFISQCDVCSNRKAFPKPAAEKPIVSIGYLTRVQMDLIDMRSIPDGEYKWILHTKDHFTKFSWVYPLHSKEAEPVAEKLLQQFYSFGAPRILQSDNGKEFVAKIIKDLKNTWPDLIIINGRSRHPQSQGLVERGNQTLESALGKWMQSNNRKDWSKGLAQVAYSINTSSARTIKKSPYEVVFGQKPRCDMEMWQVLSDQGIMDEEELPQDFIDRLNECENLTSVEDATSSDANKSLASQVQPLQTVSLSPLPSPILHMSPRAKKRRRARLFSNDQVTSLGKDEESDGDDAPSVTNHKQIRSEAEASYMNNIAKRQKLFHDALRKHEYKIGGLVGLKIDKVDRTNVTPKVLPCKIISVQSASNDMDTYQLCTTTAIISSRFQALDLLDLSNCNFRDLRDVDSSTLPTMTFIQACKAYVKTGLITTSETCNCNGTCSTKKCPCRAAKIQCGTKCHSSKTKSCSNV